MAEHSSEPMMTLSATAATAAATTPFPRETVREPGPCSFATPRGNNDGIRSSYNPYDFLPGPPRGRRGPLATMIPTAESGASSFRISRPKQPISDRLVLDLDGPRHPKHFVPLYPAPINGSTSDSSTHKNHQTHNRDQLFSSPSSEPPLLGVSWIKIRKKRSLERQKRQVQYEAASEPISAITSKKNAVRIITASTKTNTAASLQRRLVVTASSLVSDHNEDSVVSNDKKRQRVAPVSLPQVPFSTSVSSPFSAFYESNAKGNRIVSPQPKREDELVVTKKETETETSPDQKVECRKNGIARCA